MGLTVATQSSGERIAAMAPGAIAARPERLLGDDDPYRPATLHVVGAMNADGVAAHAPRRLLDQLDLGDQVAVCHVPPREPDAGRLPDHAA
jgi:hypothetical protein